MNNKILKDVVKTKEGEITFTWYSGKIIEGLKVHMVYGFCLNKKGKIVLVRDKDEKRFTLPGGKIENNDSKITDHHQQVRYLCSIENPGDFILEKDGFETVERIFIDPAKLPDYIDWINYPTGKVQFEEFLDRNTKIIS
ncbi:hypothetical protein COT44_04385 [Candidatus Shapirobacteria bacterium CG08_land_8_20_14_0_20_39_18]|uniref:Nudix hydrolase domain-containing protein n=1 Tax=Candidatus Shapirobacteria bacterium CG08_land_8_20_14_0_20_39_18 TaxID=1974883 RepID=A0A2M6XBR9_9BACT|nr:MAG: hypothetical protein COT44_04385 [Candidatus Shapirobacteria bacterium CG08_land_8_20_14_0_20_39_18]PIY65296.1 MAG: hypothetical protein COY91_02675 [Candidatus Shapirobacteria bacterium CG_4_10_14_0_8_um_filter_39_15]PJE68371.1 MAG: hypothetical protein COU94_02200 [Candidatus Shapirobacteria bacterium CG10_big_fil_rev_8_21_14_0_10_38_8]